MSASPETGSRPKVGIIIVAYNDAFFLERCIASIRGGTRNDAIVYIIDNSTTDAVQSGFAGREGIEYRRNPDNLGFCEANNVGITLALAAGCRHVLLLNHDTMLEPRCLEILVERAENLGGRNLVTAKIALLPGKERLWYGGGYFSPWIGAGKNLGFNSPDQGQFDIAGATTYATGCCMLVPVEIFAAVGMLKPEIFMYLDDIEFCLRVRRAGFGIFYEPKAMVYHELGSGADLASRPDYYLYFSIRNKPLVWQGFPYRAYLHLVALAFALVKILQFALMPGIKERGKKIRALCWGAWDSFTPQAHYRKRFPRLFRAPGN